MFGKKSEDARETFTPDNVTPEAIHAVFESALFDTGIENGEVFVKGRLRSWVELTRSKKHLRFACYISTPKSNEDKSLRFVNKVNDEMIVLRAASNNGGRRVVFDHYLPLQGGLSKLTLVQAFRLFEELLADAIGRDHEDVFG